MTDITLFFRTIDPEITSEEIEHLVWNRSAYPFVKFEPKKFYKIFSGNRRAQENSIVLCDHCNNKAIQGKYICLSCKKAIELIHS